MTWRHVPTRIVLLLMLGAIVNVALAWVCATTLEFAPWRDTQPADSVQIDFWKRNAPPWVDDEPVQLFTRRWSAIGGNGEVIFEEPQGMDSAPPSVEHVVTGFPFASLAYEWWFDSSSVFDGPSAIRREERRGVWEPRIQVREFKSFGLPLRPIWPGFLVDTLLSAAVIWTLYASFVVRRRRRRLKRGRCPTCNYDLRATTTGVCPECGAALQCTTPRRVAP